MCADDLVTLWATGIQSCPEPLKDPAQDVSEMPCGGEAGETGRLFCSLGPSGQGSSWAHSLFGISASPSSAPLPKPPCSGLEWRWSDAPLGALSRFLGS